MRASSRQAQASRRRIDPGQCITCFSNINPKASAVKMIDKMKHNKRSPSNHLILGSDISGALFFMLKLLGGDIRAKDPGVFFIDARDTDQRCEGSLILIRVPIECIVW